jgi:transposase
MPRPHIAMRKIREMLRLRLGEGLSLRQVSASLQIPFTTVCDHLRRAEEAGLTWPIPEFSDEELEELLFAKPALPGQRRVVPDWSKVHSELRRKGVTLMLLWLEYRESHPDDGLGYSQFCERYRVWRRHLDVVMRQTHTPGEKLFVDFPGQRIPVYDPATGEIVLEAELFVAVLGASSYLYAEAIRSQELLHWVNAHVKAFEFYEGCPAILVPDNLASAVTKAHRYEPDVNATYQDMATHYGVAVIPARAGKPRDKAKVEAGVLLVERWIMARLRNRHFVSIAEANAEIAGLVAWINNRPFRKLDGTRRSVYLEIDRPALQPLPAKRYELSEFKEVKVNIDYHVEADRHYYSVPYIYVGEVLDLRMTVSTVEIFRHGKRVASHLRSFQRSRFSTDVAHMPESHRRHAEWTPSRIIAWTEKTGPSTARLAAGIMERRPHPEQGFRSCLGIVRLGTRFGAERVEAACRRALSASSFSYRSVESILRNGLDKQPLPTEQPERTHPTHDNLRGPDYYS